jgi:hypothetical protein
MSTLTYTQHTVAFPTLGMSPEWHKDEVEVVLDPDGDGPSGEFNWTFMEFTETRGAQLQCFGDGLPCLFDERVQRVVAAWRAMENPDSLTPEGLIALLESEGASPSEYHLHGLGGRP